MTSIENGYTPSIWGKAASLELVFALGYFGFETVLGLADWKVNGLLLIFFGFSLVLFGVNVLLIKDILPVGEYTRPDSLGAVIRMVSLAATSVVLWPSGES